MRQFDDWSFLFLLLCLMQWAAGQDGEYEDVTRNQAFQCRWFGGSGATLKCQCREDAQVKENIKLKQNETEAVYLISKRVSHWF